MSSFMRPSSYASLHPFPTRRSSDLRELTQAEKQDENLKQQSENLNSLSKSIKSQEKQLSELEKFKKLLFLRFKDRKSTRLNSSHVKISYAVFCLKKKNRPT